MEEKNDNEEEDDEAECKPCYDEDKKFEAFSFMMTGGKAGKGGKGGKGDKGKGDAQFDGVCYYCGKYGHRTNQCRKKDADMKGMGKRGYKGGQLRKGGGFQPKGKGLDGKGQGKGNGGWKSKGVAYSWDNYSLYENAIEKSGMSNLGA